jgi:hypothetical protein
MVAAACIYQDDASKRMLPFVDMEVQTRMFGVQFDRRLYNLLDAGSTYRSMGAKHVWVILYNRIQVVTFK